MSRALILDSLRADGPLGQLVPTSNIIADPTGEGRPSELVPMNFIVLRWEEQDWNETVKRGPRNLTIWVHTPKEISDSYNDIDKILVRVSQIIGGIEQQTGADGWRVTMAWASGGWSGDLVDEGYNTICRNAAFKVLTNSA